MNTEIKPINMTEQDAAMIANNEAVIKQVKFQAKLKALEVATQFTGMEEKVEDIADRIYQWLIIDL